MVNCEAVMKRSPRILFILIMVAVWVVLVTVLHVSINGRRPATPGAEARTLQVGGLPVT